MSTETQKVDVLAVTSSETSRTDDWDAEQAMWQYLQSINPDVG